MASQGSQSAGDSQKTTSSTSSVASTVAQQVAQNSAAFVPFTQRNDIYKNWWEKGAYRALQLAWERTNRDFPGTFRGLKYRDFLEEGLSLLASADCDILAEVCGSNVPLSMKEDSEFKAR